MFEDGVWRTIGGRKVFIQKGKSLSQAMKDSGKFSKSKSKQNNKPKRLEELSEKEKKEFEDYENAKVFGYFEEEYSPEEQKRLDTKYLDRYNENKDRSWYFRIQNEPELLDRFKETEKYKKLDKLYKKEVEDMDKRNQEFTKEAVNRLVKGEELKKKELLKKNSELSDKERKTKLEQLEQKKQETQGFIQKGAIQEEIDMVKDGFDGTKKEYREYVAKEQERRLAEYRKEKEERIKTFKEQNNEKDDYRMAHRPTETGLTADNLLKKGNEVEAPKDIYEHPEYYSSNNKDWNRETIEQLNKVRGNENAEITIYRATTGNKINSGDWVTLSKSYAEAHNKGQLDGKGKILEMKVKAKDVQFAGDMLEEWGYFPKKSSREIYMKAYNEYKKEHPNSKLTFNKFKEMNYK